MELGRKPNDPSAGYIEEDSDLEFSDCAEPSSDEDTGYAQCPLEQDNLSSDEFEKDMESQAKEALREVLGASLADLVNGGELKPKPVEPAQPAQAAGPSKAAGKPEEAEVEYYDDIYFDSDSGEEEANGNGGEKKEKKKRKTKVRKLTNDELFYDPDMDDEDERWVTRQRMAYHNVKAARELVQGQGVDAQRKAAQPSTIAAAMPTSDAVLNCPACMSTLCIDCQRHELYPQQYRAMFVMNCKILKGEVLKFAPKQDKRASKRKRGKEVETESSAHNLETFHPVHCSICDTEVAVYDQDEVYHFFSVLASVP